MKPPLTHNDPCDHPLQKGARDGPLMFTVELYIGANTATSATVSDFLNTNVPAMHDLIQNVHARITASTGSRCITYRSINPDFALHTVYRERHVVDDRFRISFTRFRVSGHNLAIETGRWNRRGRGRLPLEERLCVCGEVQTERHVVEDCPISGCIRLTYGLESLEDLFNTRYTDDLSCKIIHDILNLYS